ncbi:hypothetical protein JTB14_005292, partial [Gonioctena quinquepunctata]
GFDVNVLYNGVREKLRDPEREVRQHALRVLVDLIPVTQSLSLDDYMRELVPELLSNLGHSAPSLRKSALDSLRKYLQYSKNYDELLMKLISTTENNVVAAAPFLISSETGDETLGLVIDQLWRDLSNPRLNQEVTAKSLARIRYSLGDDKFKTLVGAERYDEIKKICDSFGLPVDYSSTSENEIEGRLNNIDEEIEDRVILETEITLKTGPAITMKIHEESRPNSVMCCSADSDDALQSLGILEVLEDDSGSDFYETARRTPRKVRFGGESVKLRTPESDSSNNEEHRSTIRITVTDAISIKTKRINHRLHKSTPNLVGGHSHSRIPLKKNPNVREKLRITTGNKKDKTTNESTTSHENRRDKNDHNSAPSSRIGEVLSPSPPHKEIELFHNLTRSPKRVKETPQRKSNSETKDEVDHNNFDTFELPTESLKENSNVGYFQDEDKGNSQSLLGNSMEEEISSSFQVCTGSKMTDLLPAVSENRNERSPVQFPNDLYKQPGKVSKMIPMTHVDKTTKKENGTTYNSFRVYERSMDIPIEKNKINSDNEGVSYNSFQVYSGKSGPRDNENNVPVEGNGNILDNNGQNAKQQGNTHHKRPISCFLSEERSWNETETLDSLLKMLKQSSTYETLEAGPAALLFEALFSCKHQDKLHFLANDALVLMVNGLQVDVLEQCLGRIAPGVSRIGSPLGVSLALMVMKKCRAKLLQMEIMSRCFAHKLREGALQILMAAARLLPSSDIEISKITEFAATDSEIDEDVSVINQTPDHEYLVRVVRTRLSRRQLPAVEVDGTVLYSTPRELTELEWLADNHVKPSPSSSASSSTHSVNYWKHNSRHEGERNTNVNLSSNEVRMTRVE